MARALFLIFALVMLLGVVAPALTLAHAAAPNTACVGDARPGTGMRAGGFPGGFRR